MKAPKRYPLNQSPLYAVMSKRKLANLFGLPLRDLVFLTSLGDRNYQQWPLRQKPRDQIAGIRPPVNPRVVQEPMPLLRALHDQIAALLSKLEKPHFVFSASKGRSYLDNALEHRDNLSYPAFKVDIKRFYPSVKIWWVRRFFEHDMRCAPDVSRLLARLCCMSGALPTGSPLSPALSYFACAPIFRWMQEFAELHGLKFTLYVDDMFFSGAKASQQLSRSVLRYLAINGFRGHKVAHFSPGQPRVITGVALSTQGVSIPFKRQKLTRLYERAFLAADDPESIHTLGKTLLGQYREGERLQRGSSDRAGPIQHRLDQLEPEKLKAKGRTRSAARKRKRLPKTYVADQVQRLRNREGQISTDVEETPVVG